MDRLISLAAPRWRSSYGKELLWKGQRKSRPEPHSSSNTPPKKFFPPIYYVMIDSWVIHTNCANCRWRHFCFKCVIQGSFNIYPEITNSPPAQICQFYVPNHTKYIIKSENKYKCWLVIIILALHTFPVVISDKYRHYDTFIQYGSLLYPSFGTSTIAVQI